MHLVGYFHYNAQTLSSATCSKQFTSCHITLLTSHIASSLPSLLPKHFTANDLPFPYSKCNVNTSASLLPSFLCSSLFWISRGQINFIRFIKFDYNQYQLIGQTVHSDRERCTEERTELLSALTIHPREHGHRNQDTSVSPGLFLQGLTSLCTMNIISLINENFRKISVLTF